MELELIIDKEGFEKLEEILISPQYRIVNPIPRHSYSKSEFWYEQLSINSDGTITIEEIDIDKVMDKYYPLIVDTRSYKSSNEDLMLDIGTALVNDGYRYPFSMANYHLNERCGFDEDHGVRFDGTRMFTRYSYSERGILNCECGSELISFDPDSLWKRPIGLEEDCLTCECGREITYVLSDTREIAYRFDDGKWVEESRRR